MCNLFLLQQSNVRCDRFMHFLTFASGHRPAVTLTCKIQWRHRLARLCDMSRWHHAGMYLPKPLSRMFAGGGCFCAHPPSEQRPLAVAKHYLCPELTGTGERVQFSPCLRRAADGVQEHLTLNPPASAAEMLLWGLGSSQGGGVWGEKGILGPKSQWLYWLGPFQNHFDFSVGYFLSGYKF